MTDYDFTFLDREQEYTEVGTDLKAVREYYSQRPTLQDYMYTVRVENERRVYPMWTTTELLTLCDLDAIIGEFEVDEKTKQNKDALSQEAVRISRANGDEITEDINDYAWNGKLYRLTDINVSDFGFTLDFGITDYYSTLVHRNILSREISQRLFQENVVPTASIPQLRDAMIPPLTERENVLGSKKDIFNFSNRPTKVGVSALLVIQYEGEPHIVFINRSMSAAEFPGMVGLAPAGMLDVGDEKAPELESRLYREFSEELFGVSEEESKQSDTYTEIQKIVKGESASLVHTGTGIDMKQGAVHIQSLLYIEDETIVEKIVESNKTGWEVDDRFLVPISDSERLKGITEIGTLAPVNSIGVFEGLRVLEERFDVEIPLDFELYPVGEY